LLPAAAKLKETHPEARLRLVVSLRPAAMLGRINHMIDVHITTTLPPQKKEALPPHKA